VSLNCAPAMYLFWPSLSAESCRETRVPYMPAAGGEMVAGTYP
jgi:hypothetical protein